MSKSASTKPKPPPWIPPGKGTPQYKKRSKPVTIIKSRKDESVPAEVSPEGSPQWHAVNIPKKGANQDVDADMMSLSSHSSYELGRIGQENEMGIHHVSLLQEMKLSYVHFESLKTSFLSAHRLIDYRDLKDSNLTELFNESGSFLQRLNALFDDLEYAVSVLENTLNESEKEVEFSTVLRTKEKLLSTLLEMYDKVILIYQFAFEKQDFIELSRVQESLNEQLKKAERKCSSQEAIITDLERRISIYQGKTASLESYKTTIESDRDELHKMLLHKESQIKYLKNELMNSSEKHSKSDREDFIEIIESIKSKAHNEKSALKKALKFLKTQSKEKEETYKKLIDEANEKEKMMFDLAAQRDQLKVQLTVFNNNVIQLKQQIEEMKIQNMKFEKEMIEKDTFHKKEVIQLKGSIEEKIDEFDESLKKKKKLEEKIVELENKLKMSEASLKAFKNETDASRQLNSHTSGDIPQLIALLQNTRKTLENFVPSDHVMSASGDHIRMNTDFDSNKSEILSAISEVKKYILELRNQLLAFLHDERDVTEPKSPLKKNDLEKQFQKMEQKYKSISKENESLRQKLEDFRKSSNLPTSAIAENYLSTDISSNNHGRKLQLEICIKNEEILKLKSELDERKKDLENYFRESKDKLRILEANEAKITSLEEELKSSKMEVAVLQRKKEEEITTVLQRAQELQESLDKKTDECRNLENYIQLIKVSYFKVFDSS